MFLWYFEKMASFNLILLIYIILKLYQDRKIDGWEKIKSDMKMADVVQKWCERSCQVEV